MALFKVKIYVKYQFDNVQINFQGFFVNLFKVSLTIYKIRLQGIYFAKKETETEPWGKSGLEQYKGSRAYPYLFKTKNQSHCVLKQFQEEKMALYKNKC